LPKSGTDTEGQARCPRPEAKEPGREGLAYSLWTGMERAAEPPASPSLHIDVTVFTCV